MLASLFDKLGRRRIIYDRLDNEPYLERYYLFLKDRNRFPFNVFLHKFLKGDPDDLHDHPWPYATLILSGGYWEVVPEDESLPRKADGSLVTKRIWRGPGHFRLCPPNSYHRVELEPDVTCWTLFMPGPQRRDWGFDVNGVWMQFEKYFTWRLNK